MRKSKEGRWLTPCFFIVFWFCQWHDDARVNKVLDESEQSFEQSLTNC